jgi:hypothetical protein
MPVDDPAAADRLPDALQAARRAAEQLGLRDDEMTVLHRSNNVVLRAEDTVLKVGTSARRLYREAAVARFGAQQGGPTLRPLAEPVQVGDFTVTSWPFVRAALNPASDEEAGWALRALHAALVGVPDPLPQLADRFAGVRGLLDDRDRTRALAEDGRTVLLSALDRLLIDGVQGDPVLHTEPHDGNRLTTGSGVVYIDLDAVSRGPLEWDLAYMSDAVAETVWPEHDRLTRELLVMGVSACVSAYCWRHVTARPGDKAMRWHAEHHLNRVRGIAG